MPAPMVYSNALSGPPCGCVRRVRESAENPPLAPRAIEPVGSLDVCAYATLESAEQSAAFPTATMMRSKIGMRYLRWPAGRGWTSNNRLELNDLVSHRDVLEKGADPELSHLRLAVPIESLKVNADVNRSKDQLYDA